MHFLVLNDVIVLQRLEFGLPVQLLCDGIVVTTRLSVT